SSAATRSARWRRPKRARIRVPTDADGARESVTGGVAASPHAGPVRDRDLRRFERPDPEEALSRALLAGLSPPLARRFRRRRRRAYRGVRRGVQGADEGGCSTAR